MVFCNYYGCTSVSAYNTNSPNVSKARYGIRLSWLYLLQSVVFCFSVMADICCQLKVTAIEPSEPMTRISMGSSIGHAKHPCV
jgi:hypothetical protein